MMKQIVQTNFEGIDGLQIVDTDVPALTANGVLVKMTAWPVVPTDWKRESNPSAVKEDLAQLPRAIGIGGVGRVIEVGKNRDQALLNQRVLLMQPTGSYQEIILSENPDWLFMLPDAVDDASAAALTAGPGTAKTLKAVIDNAKTQSIVITGANSVIGLYLMQMLANDPHQILPVVSSTSLAYFNEQVPSVKAYTPDELPELQQATVIDIAGSEAFLTQLMQHISESVVTSIVLQPSEALPQIHFVHEDFNPNDYRYFIEQMANGELVAPIDRRFDFDDIKAAQHYGQDHHSRGRIIVTNN